MAASGTLGELCGAVAWVEGFEGHARSGDVRANRSFGAPLVWAPAADGAEVTTDRSSHLHADHVGWVGDPTGRPVFPNARFVVGLGDWEYFMARDDALRPHVRESLQWLDGQGRVVLPEGETQVAPGLTRLSAPGHTPGHSLFVVHDGRARMLLLGDAVYCPQQLSHSDWQAASDASVCPPGSSRTRPRFRAEPARRD